MRFLSLNHIVQSAQAVARRFPFAIFNALAGTLTALSLIHFEDLIEVKEPYFNLIMTTVLGTLLFTAIELFIERAKLSPPKALGIQLWALIFLVVYYLLLPADFEYESAEFVIRFVLLGIAFTLSITFAPFIGHRQEANGFWQHNKTLFIRLFFTFVYSLVLFLGLVLALVSMDHLLNVNVPEETYGKLFVFIFGFISVPFFLAGVPQKLAALEKATDYPKGIRLFSQYILLPLLLIYALILYIYSGRILAAWDWPEGMVSYLIIVFALGGMLTYLLLFPMITHEAERSALGKAQVRSRAKETTPAWVRLFSRGIYALILPMTVVFFLALRIRIMEYGITELRYYGVILCFWFAAMSLYFLVSKKRNVMIFSVTLFGIVLLSSFGPWGAIAVAEDSQLNRLEQALTRNGLLVNGKAVKAAADIPRDDQVIISSTLDYLYRFHGTEVIQPWFEEDLAALRKRQSMCYQSQCAMELLGINYLSAWERPDDSFDAERPFYASAMQQGIVMPVEGYRYAVRFDAHSTDSVFEAGEESYRLFTVGTLLVIKRGELTESIELQPLIDSLRAQRKREFSQEEMTVEQGDYKLFISWLSDNKGQHDPSVTLNGILLVR